MALENRSVVRQVLYLALAFIALHGAVALLAYAHF